MSWVRFLFSFQGRINRLQSLTGIYGFGVLFMLAPMLVSVLLGQVGGGILIVGAFGTLILVGFAFMTVSQIAIAVRRAHDIGLSGWVIAWWALFVSALVALQLIWPALDGSVVEILLISPTVLVAFSLFVVPGQPLANRFGEPPRPGWLP